PSPPSRTYGTTPVIASAEVSTERDPTAATVVPAGRRSSHRLRLGSFGGRAGGEGARGCGTARSDIADHARAVGTPRSRVARSACRRQSADRAPHGLAEPHPRVALSHGGG